jgi:adenylate cyclase
MATAIEKVVKKPKILVVDDTVRNIQVLEAILRDRFRINIALNGLQALDLADKVKPDLILLDVMMPELDGFETCKRLKANPETHDIPVIFLTARVDLDDVVRGLELGAVDYVTKPFNPTELMKRVDSHLELKFAREKMAALAGQLSKYLSPYVYRSIFEGQTEAKISSYRKHLTVFFSDIQGFTTRAEEMEPQALTTWLNGYLNEMSKILLAHGGTLDKFEGDGVMAFFGDPTSEGESEDATRCLKMAIEMQEKAAKMGIDVRMGIDSGLCTVGNFGSDEQMDYTIIGQIVNTASRLESSCEPGRILVTQAVKDLVGNEILFIPHGDIQLPGIERDLTAYWVDP